MGRKQSNNTMETRDTRVSASRKLWTDVDDKMERIGCVNRSELFRNLMREFAWGGSKGVQNGTTGI